MYSKTYIQLAEYLPVLLPRDSRHPGIRTVIGMTFLQDSSEHFRDFYGNHYLSQALGLDNLASLATVRSLLSFIFEHPHLLSDLNKLEILYEVENGYQVVTNAKVQGGHNILKSHITETIASLSRTPMGASEYSVDEPTEEMMRDLMVKGYFIVPEFLTYQELSSFNTEITNIAQAEIDSGHAYLYGLKGKNQRIYNLPSKSKHSLKFLSSNFLDRLGDSYFDRPTFHQKYGLSSMAGHIIPTGGESMPWHIDAAVPKPIPDWRIRLIAIICLQEFTEANGAPGVVLGSHKYRRPPESKEDIDHANSNEVILTAPAGSLIVWDGSLWHRSRDNITSCCRQGIIVSLAASFFKEICGEEEHLVVVPDTLKSKLSPRVRYMIGLDRGIKKGALLC